LPVSSIIICGGSVVGLTTAMLLARDGHEVTVLERDQVPAAPADQAWDGWERSGVAQFRQPHVLLARTRHVLEAELPGLTDDLLAAGCVRLDQLAAIPPAMTGWQREPDDDRLVTITGRRPVVESVLAAAAASTPGVTVHRGTGATANRRDPAHHRGPHRRRRTARRPRHRRHRAADQAGPLAGRGGREAADRGGRGQRLRLLHAVFHRARAARADRPGGNRARHDLAAHDPRRQRDLVGHGVRRVGRQAAPAAA
jgi:glycine/D-amino acid oxidase-like deaminating enzyme